MTPAEHAAPVRELETTVRKAFPASRPGDRLTATRRQEAQEALRQIVALAEHATDIDSRVEALMAELERGYILRSTHDSIVQGLAERATELERDRDAWRNNCLDAQESLAVRREKQEAAEARAEQLETALREIEHRATTRRTGVLMDGTETWAVPLAGEIARIARAALDGGTATLPGREEDDAGSESRVAPGQRQHGTAVPSSVVSRPESADGGTATPEGGNG